MKATAPKPVAKQSIAVRDANDAPTVYKDIDGNEVSLSQYVVNNYISPGGDFTQQECWSLINLSKARGLNPITRDCFFIRYDGKPSVVVSKDYYTKRACKNPNYLGKENGIVVVNRNGEIEMRTGTIKLKDEELLGGWCKVYMANLKYPVTVTAALDEYARKDKDGKLQATWKTKTCLMIEKVAIVRALKEAMTEEFGGTYAAEEFGESEEEVSANVKDSAIDNIPTEKPSNPAPKAKDAEFVEVDDSTGEVVEASEDDMEDLEFQAMQDSFFK